MYEMNDLNDLSKQQNPYEEYYEYCSSNAPQVPPEEPPQPKKQRKWGKNALIALGMVAVVGVSAATGAFTAYRVVGGASGAQDGVLSGAQETPTPTDGGNSGGSGNGVSGTPLASGAALNVVDLSGAAEKASASVVDIMTKTQVQQNSFFGGMYGMLPDGGGEQEATGAGSGVIISADGYIATNHHVVDESSEIVVRLADGTEYPAVLVGKDAQTDIAVLKIDATGLTPITFADSDSVRVGQAVIAIGNPLGELGGTVTDGVISAKERDVTLDGETLQLMQTSAAVNSGNSGGGLFDANGNLVGMVNSKSMGLGVEGLAFAIPSNTVQEIVTDIMENGYVTGRAQLGISVVQISEEQAALYKGVNPGVHIVETLKNNGLKEGDRIVSIDGKEINVLDDVTGILEAHSVGDVLQVEVERDGQVQTVEVPLSEQLPDYMQEQQKAA